MIGDTEDEGDNILMEGGGVMIGDTEDEGDNILMEGGGVMIGDEEAIDGYIDDEEKEGKVDEETKKRKKHGYKEEGLESDTDKEFGEEGEMYFEKEEME